MTARLEHKRADQSFTDRVSQIFKKLDYRIAETPTEKGAIYKLRYVAYLDEKAIQPSFSKELTDKFDESENAWNFAVYLDQKLVGSIRIHVATADMPIMPAMDSFSDILGPMLDAGQIIIDPTRFVVDQGSARAHPELPYVMVRLPWMAAEYFQANSLLVSVRKEHQAFYRRVFGHTELASERPYGGLLKPLTLMCLDCRSARDRVYRRYPFFRSSVLERERLFKRTPRMAPSNLRAASEAETVEGSDAALLNVGDREHWGESEVREQLDSLLTMFNSLRAASKIAEDMGHETSVAQKQISETRERLDEQLRKTSAALSRLINDAG